MPSRCTFVEDVEFEPLDGGNVHFTFVTGDERMRFCMATSAVRRSAAQAAELLDSANRKQSGELAMFPRR